MSPRPTKSRTSSKGARTRALIETDVLLWWATGSDRLSAPTHALIKDGRNEILWIAASTWELTVKESLGRIRIAGGIRTFLKEVLSEQAIRILPIQQAHALAIGELIW